MIPPAGPDFPTGQPRDPRAALLPAPVPALRPAPPNPREHPMTASPAPD